jgi:predicted nucleic acid-binding protein
MNAPEFLDTNVLLYAYDPGDSRRQEIARDLVRRAMRGEIVISTQVLAEFAAALLHKLKPPAKPKEVIAILETLGPIKTVVPDGDIVRRAVEARASYGVHFYDGMIIAAAERAGCRTIWSEDLNAGQKYFGVPVRNPFAG